MKTKTSFIIVTILIAFTLPAAAVFGAGIELVSVDSLGQQGDGESNYTSCSLDGRHVAFWTTNSLVDIDTNEFDDIYVRDRVLGTTVIVSVNNEGFPGDLGSVNPSISHNGRFIAFDSMATNFHPGCGGLHHIYIHDRDADGNGIFDEPGGISTELISINNDGNHANDVSYHPAISGDGNSVAFYSLADNLVGGDNNGWGDVFVRDRLAGTTELVSVSTLGEQGNYASGYPSINEDGTQIAFRSIATNLLDYPILSYSHIYVRDRQNSKTVMVSVNDNGEIENLFCSIPNSISSDGRFVAFSSASTNLDLLIQDNNNCYDVFVHDRDSDKDGIFDESGGIATFMVSLTDLGEQGDGGSGSPSISNDGNFVAFWSLATNFELVNNELADVFLRDIEAGTTTLVSESWDGQGADGNSGGDLNALKQISLSNYANLVSFVSEAGNLLVEEDTNGNVKDVFVKAMSTIEITFAVYDYVLDELEVHATSPNGIDASLEVVGYGPMLWNKKKSRWELRAPEDTPPSSMTVCGPLDGCRTVY